MSLGTPPFTANGFTSGSVNRPWHRSRPTAAARTWIMHGGKFKKWLPASRRLHWNSVFGESQRQILHGFYRSWNICVLQSSSALKEVFATCRRQIILGFILLLFFIYTAAWELEGVTIVWRLNLQSFFNPLNMCDSTVLLYLLIHFVHHI